MRFLRKPAETPPEFDLLDHAADASVIRSLLLTVQRGFCAYSEKWREPLDALDVEHFDPRPKHTAQDGFRNWYAVLHTINNRKARKIERFLPLPDPGTADVQARIKYDDGQFVPADDTDHEIERLIRYIRANDELTVMHRDGHVSQVADLQRWKATEAELHAHLRQHPQLLSFPSALEKELGIPAFDLIDSLPPPEIPA